MDLEPGEMAAAVDHARGMAGTRPGGYTLLVMNIHRPLPTAPETRRRRRDPASTRERLIRAALDLFTTRGFHDSTTPEIARKAGIAEGTIYRHFPSKTSLLNELYRGATELFVSVVVETANLPSCRERMSRIAHRWREIAGRDPALAKLVFVSPPTGLFDSRSKESQAKFRAEVEKVLASGKASGEIRAGSVTVWADVWLQLITLTLDRIAKGDWEPDHPAVRQVAESAWDAIAAPKGHD